MTKLPLEEQPARAPQGAEMKDYLKEAFFFRWNLLLFLGGTAAAAQCEASVRRRTPPRERRRRRWRLGGDAMLQPGTSSRGASKLGASA